MKKIKDNNKYIHVHLIISFIYHHLILSFFGGGGEGRGRGIL